MYWDSFECIIRILYILYYVLLGYYIYYIIGVDYIVLYFIVDLLYYLLYDSMEYYYVCIYLFVYCIII